MDIAIVTGASGGIGYHTALQLAADGKQVILAARDRERGLAAAALVRGIVPRPALLHVVRARLLGVGDDDAGFDGGR